jgi:flagellar hook assembly protein FlgD
VAYSKFPGDYALKIYNSAGEHVRTLDSQTLTGTWSQSYLWDGKNKYGDKCASGIYVLYLREPFGTKLKRLLILR